MLPMLFIFLNDQWILGKSEIILILIYQSFGHPLKFSCDRIFPGQQLGICEFAFGQHLVAFDFAAASV